MKITLSDTAKQQLATFAASNECRLQVIDGCCGKSFAFGPNQMSLAEDIVIQDNGVTFYIDQESAKIAPEIVIDHPGPIEGYMITNLNATGGCGCGRSFFVEE